MYSSFQLAQKYFKYYITAKNGRGHGIHSPFVFDFVTNVLNDKKKYDCYKKIELLRNKLLHDETIINVEDFGAGSSTLQFKQRKIKDIAKSSLKNKKFAQLLYRIARYYQSINIIELGTSLGITTCYLASANDKSSVYSFEGSEEIVSIARKNFNTLSLKNIDEIEGNFDNTILPALLNIENVDMAFIDGNHRKESTLRYFDLLLKKSSNDSVFIFDDIHWSADMEDAWKLIQADDSVTLTIDLFFIGLVFLKKDFRVKQHFSIRF